MIQKKSDKRIPEIEPKFDRVLVFDEKKSAPFIEILFQEPENITSQNLGKLIGVLEVTDTSEDSSYIVNYLISVIKKEYYSKPKRGPIESLESALHKANLALSKLAEHGNVGWLGKLNAIIAVTEKNNLHLSQAGSATAFLLRSKTMTNISDGLSTEELEPHPLKTFVNVSSGRLEISDKLIISTDSIFNIFSEDELKKSALRFSNSDFVQFLKTALGSELERAAVLIADLDKKVIVAPGPAIKSRKETNVFSQTAFAKNSNAKPTSPGENEDVETEIRNEIKVSGAEFTDEKTGHIYIKEDNNPLSPQTSSNLIEDFLDFIALFWQKIMRLISRLNHQIANLRIPKINLPELKPKIIQKQLATPENINLAVLNNLRVAAQKILSQTARALKQLFSSEKRKRTYYSLQENSAKIAAVTSGILPKFSRIRTAFAKMDYQQKIYALLAFIIIFIVPLFIVRIQNNLQAEKNRQLAAQQIQPIAIPLAQDKNIIRTANLSTISSGNNFRHILNLKNAFFAITDTAILEIANNKSFSLPQDFGSVSKATTMNDLNLIFLLNDSGKIISFSPISNSFQNNAITIPSDSNIAAIGTYLTYIYMVDSKNNQIYRYPRAEGGFGEKTNWLKDTNNLTDAIDLVMNDSLFLTNGSTVTKLFKGKNQGLDIEETATPIKINKLALGSQSNNIYILDSANSRIIHLDSDGKILAQYYNQNLREANNIAIDETNGLAYFSSPSSIQTLDLN